MDNKEQQRCMKRINWDYNISIDDMLAVVNGEKSYAGHWDQEKLLIRMLERLSWYNILDFFGAEFLAKRLKTEILYRLRNEEKRTKYERLGKILRGESVSFTKWGAKYSAESRDTLFSNRWYSS